MKANYSPEMLHRPLPVLPSVVVLLVVAKDPLAEFLLVTSVVEHLHHRATVLPNLVVLTIGAPQGGIYFKHKLGRSLTVMSVPQ